MSRHPHYTRPINSRGSHIPQRIQPNSSMVNHNTQSSTFGHQNNHQNNHQHRRQNTESTKSYERIDILDSDNDDVIVIEGNNRDDNQNNSHNSTPPQPTRLYHLQHDTTHSNQHTHSNPHQTTHIITQNLQNNDNNDNNNNNSTRKNPNQTFSPLKKLSKLLGNEEPPPSSTTNMLGLRNLNKNRANMKMAGLKTPHSNDGKNNNDGNITSQSPSSSTSQRNKNIKISRKDFESGEFTQKGINKCVEKLTNSNFGSNKGSQSLDQNIDDQCNTNNHNGVNDGWCNRQSSYIQPSNLNKKNSQNCQKTPSKVKKKKSQNNNNNYNSNNNNDRTVYFLNMIEAQNKALVDANHTISLLHLKLNEHKIKTNNIEIENKNIKEKYKKRKEFFDQINVENISLKTRIDMLCGVINNGSYSSNMNRIDGSTHGVVDDSLIKQIEIQYSQLIQLFTELRSTPFETSLDIENISEKNLKTEIPNSSQNSSPNNPQQTILSISSQLVPQHEETLTTPTTTSHISQSGIDGSEMEVGTDIMNDGQIGSQKLSQKNPPKPIHSQNHQIQPHNPDPAHISDIKTSFIQCPTHFIKNHISNGLSTFIPDILMNCFFILFSSFEQKKFFLTIIDDKFPILERLIGSNTVNNNREIFCKLFDLQPEQLIDVVSFCDAFSQLHNETQQLVLIEFIDWDNLFFDQNNNDLKGDLKSDLLCLKNEDILLHYYQKTLLQCVDMLIPPLNEYLTISNNISELPKSKGLDSSFCLCQSLPHTNAPNDILSPPLTQSNQITPFLTKLDQFFPLFDQFFAKISKNTPTITAPTNPPSITPHQTPLRNVFSGNYTYPGYNHQLISYYNESSEKIPDCLSQSSQPPQELIVKSRDIYDKILGQYGNGDDGSEDDGSQQRGENNDDRNNYKKKSSKMTREELMELVDENGVRRDYWDVHSVYKNKTVIDGEVECTKILENNKLNKSQLRPIETPGNFTRPVKVLKNNIALPRNVINYCANFAQNDDDYKTILQFQKKQNNLLYGQDSDHGDHSGGFGFDCGVMGDSDEDRGQCDDDRNEKNHDQNLGPQTSSNSQLTTSISQNIITSQGLDNSIDQGDDSDIFAEFFQTQLSQNIGKQKINQNELTDLNTKNHVYTDLEGLVAMESIGEEKNEFQQTQKKPKYNNNVSNSMPNSDQSQPSQVNYGDRTDITPHDEYNSFVQNSSENPRKNSEKNSETNSAQNSQNSSTHLTDMSIQSPPKRTFSQIDDVYNGGLIRTPTLKLSQREKTNYNLSPNFNESHSLRHVNTSLCLNDDDESLFDPTPGGEGLVDGENISQNISRKTNSHKIDPQKGETINEMVNSSKMGDNGPAIELLDTQGFLDTSTELFDKLNHDEDDTDEDDTDEENDRQNNGGNAPNNENNAPNNNQKNPPRPTIQDIQTLHQFTCEYDDHYLGTNIVLNAPILPIAPVMVSKKKHLARTEQNLIGFENNDKNRRKDNVQYNNTDNVRNSNNFPKNSSQIGSSHFVSQKQIQSRGNKRYQLVNPISIYNPNSKDRSLPGYNNNNNNNANYNFRSNNNNPQKDQNNRNKNHHQVINNFQVQTHVRQQHVTDLVEESLQPTTNNICTIDSSLSPSTQNVHNSQNNTNNKNDEKNDENNNFSTPFKNPHVVSHTVEEIDFSSLPALSPPDEITNNYNPNQENDQNSKENNEKNNPKNTISLPSSRYQISTIKRPKSIRKLSTQFDIANSALKNKSSKKNNNFLLNNNNNNNNNNNHTPLQKNDKLSSDNNDDLIHYSIDDYDASLIGD